MPPKKGARYDTAQRRMLAAAGTKPCPKCKEVKPASEFHKNRQKASGLEPHCKSCRSAYFKNSGHGERMRIYRYKVRYGLTEADRLALIAGQDGKCAICGNVPTGRWHTDHCHKSGKVRGMLCYSCNTLLGTAKDDAEILTNAIQYLERNRQ